MPAGSEPTPRAKANVAGAGIRSRRRRRSDRAGTPRPTAGGDCAARPSSDSRPAAQRGRPKPGHGTPARPADAPVSQGQRDRAIGRCPPVPTDQVSTQPEAVPVEPYICRSEYGLWTSLHGGGENRRPSRGRMTACAAPCYMDREQPRTSCRVTTPLPERGLFPVQIDKAKGLQRQGLSLAAPIGHHPHAIRGEPSHPGNGKPLLARHNRCTIAGSSRSRPGPS
jgi:hypothetical protein